MNECIMYFTDFCPSDRFFIIAGGFGLFALGWIVGKFGFLKKQKGGKK